MQFASCPERAAGHQIEKGWHCNRLGVVTDRRAENFCLAILIGPDHSLRSFSFAAHRLSQRRGSRPDFIDKIEFLIGNLPVFWESMQNGMIRNQIGCVGIVRAVARRCDTAKLKPIVVTGAVAVHGTVHQHRWRALLVLRDNPGTPRGVVR